MYVYFPMKGHGCFNAKSEVMMNATIQTISDDRHEP